MAPDRSVYMYRAGEAKLFASPEDVPAGEGWQDTPVAELPVDEPAEAEPIRKRKKLHLPPEAPTE